MKILHCIQTREFAGTERHVTELAAAQARTHDVSVLIARHTHDRCTNGDITPHICGDVRIIRAGRLGYFASMASAIRTLRPDVVHTHLGQASFRGRFLPAMDAPLVATLHNRFRARAFGTHDGLICIARWQMADIPPQYRGATTIIGNWTTPPPPIVPDHGTQLRARLGISDDQFLFGAAGRFVPQKCFDVLLRAFERAAIPGARLVLFGDGPERANLERIAGPGIVFAGFSHSLRADLSALDGFVLPSRCEPFGLVLLEAMSVDLPVIATRAGGVCDILGDDNPALVTPGDVDAMVAGLRQLHLMPRRKWDLSNFLLQGKLEAIDAFYATCRDRKRARGSTQ